MVATSTSSAPAPFLYSELTVVTAVLLSAEGDLVISTGGWKTFCLSTLRLSTVSACCA